MAWGILQSTTIVRICTECLDEMQGGGCSDFIEEFLQFVYVDGFLVQKKLVHLGCYQSLSVQLCLIHFTVNVTFQGVHRLVNASSL